MADVLIRPALEADVPAIQAIYAEAVRTGTGSFEIDPPDVATMVERWSGLVGGGFPYLVAMAGETDGSGARRETALLGYCYAGPYRPRPAYRFSVENSVYMAPAAQGRGIGGRLLAAVIAACEAQGRRRMIAVIGDSANLGSIRLHAAAGFAHVGVLPSVGFKHGRWLDTVLMQRALGEGDTSLPA